MESRALVAVAVPSMVLMGCAGVGSKTAEAPAKGASAYEGRPRGPLKVMGFSGEDEVAAVTHRGVQAERPQGAR